MRIDGRKEDELRNISFLTDFVETAQGSCLACFGRTKVICTATLQPGVPPFLKDTGRGWLTAQYAMLPASTNTRKSRETGKQDGRSVEIQRLIGRSLRAVVDFEILGENCIYIDCDVLQADGGTRTASITGGYVALALAAQKWLAEGLIEKNPITCQVAAVSCGVFQGVPVLDLCYAEDGKADVDANFVMTSNGDFVEVQATGEGTAFSKMELGALLTLAEKGNRRLMELQKEAVQR